MNLPDIVTIIQLYKRPNSVRAHALLDTLEVDRYDRLENSLDLLQDYASIERSDYDNAKAYGEAKAEAWDNFTDSLYDIEEIVEEAVDVTDTTDTTPVDNTEKAI